MKNIFFTVIFALAIQTLSGQEELIYASRTVQTDRLLMEYMDFGGEGMPLINVQGVHNFFGHHKGYEDSREDYIEFLDNFNETNRLLVPVRRGYGRSEDTEHGFDVATQAEDLLAFMDAMKIEKAIFFGRLIAAQTMIYLAEHHPERIAGLLFYDMILVLPDLSNPDIAEFLKYDSYGATDQGEDPWSRMEPRHIYRPHLYNDPDVRIQIPAFWFYFSGINDPDKSIHISRLKKAKEYANYDWPNPDIKEYYKDLITDIPRWDSMKKYMLKENPNSRVNEAMKRAFGENLTILNEDQYNSMSFEEFEKRIRVPKMKEFFGSINE